MIRKVMFARSYS